MMRDIDICRDVYAHIVLSSGTTMSLLDAFHLSQRKLTIDGVKSAHYMMIVYRNLVSTCYRHAKLDGMKFNGVSVESSLTPSLIWRRLLAPMDVVFVDPHRLVTC